VRFSKSLALGIFAVVASTQCAAKAQTVCTQCLRLHTSAKPTATYQSTTTIVANTSKTSTISYPAATSRVVTNPVVTNRVTTTNSYQAQAQYEAQQMASRRYKGHVRGTIPGVNFCGVGWSSSSPNAPTCRPSRSMTLVADATVRGSDGWYRVRYWR